jgi:hypothetical protein
LPTPCCLPLAQTNGSTSAQANFAAVAAKLG